MIFEHRFKCPLVNGLHARPASALSEVVGKFNAKAMLWNERTGVSADAVSVLMLGAADIRHQDPCKLIVEGADASQAFRALVDFIEHRLAACDDDLADSSSSEMAVLPPILRMAGDRFVVGRPAGPGVGRGRLVCRHGMVLPEDLPGDRGDPAREFERFVSAHELVRNQLESQLNAATPGAEAEFLKAHLAILRDPVLRDQVLVEIRNGAWVGRAVVRAARHHMKQLQQASSIYLRERAGDIQGLALQLLEALGLELSSSGIQALDGPSVVVADQLSPQEFLALDRKLLRGLVLEEGGGTSHTIILARSFGVPAIFGASGAFDRLSGSAMVLVDGYRGLVFADPSATVRRFYDAQDRKQVRMRSHQEASMGKVPEGGPEIAANIAVAVEAEMAFRHGAEAIGLFRTEMLFMEKAEAPSEEHQFEIYRQMIMAARRRPVIIRAIDVGGDKPLPYLPLPKEDNPFLGRRGIRLYPDHLELIDAQIRAVLRASAHGPVKFMAPMITTVEEAQWFRNRVLHWQKELGAKGVLLDPAMPVGMMVEVPAAALMLDHMCGIFDFFSYGTNDLLQYWQAADRGNVKVGKLYNHRHPSFIRLLRRSIWEVNARGRWVGICGDMAADAAMLPLLQALGFNEISVPVAEIPALRAARASLSKVDGRTLLERVCRCGTIDEVEMVLAAAVPAASGAQVSPEMICLNSTATTQAEAIRELVDLMHEHGRTRIPDIVETAVWAREAVSTTGFGYGIAIPHCKVDAVAVNTLGVLRLANPVDWKSTDGQPVSIVILLASRNDKVDNVHMQIFAKLCRRLMHEDFRTALSTATDAAELCAFLKNDLKC